MYVYIYDKCFKCDIWTIDSVNSFCRVVINQCCYDKNGVFLVQLCQYPRKFVKKAKLVGCINLFNFKYMFNFLYILS